MAAASQDADVPCLRCEYNLRGLDRGGNCPECGQPIEPSWARYELQLAQGWTPLNLASPVFLKRMGWGCILLLASAGMMTGTMIYSILTVDHFVRAPLAVAPWAAAAILLAGGLWLLGTREPSQPRGQTAVRWIIRAGAVVELLHFAFTFSSGFLSIIFLNNLRVDVMSYVIAMAVVTLAAHVRLGSLMKRSDAPRGIFRAEILFACLWPPIMVLQGIAFSAVPFRSGATWLVRPEAVIGQIQGSIVFLYALIQTNVITLSNVDAIVIFWSIAIALTVATLLLVVTMAKIFFAAAGRDRDGKAA